MRSVVGVFGFASGGRLGMRRAGERGDARGRAGGTRRDLGAGAVASRRREDRLERAPDRLGGFVPRMLVHARRHARLALAPLGRGLGERASAFGNEGRCIACDRDDVAEHRPHVVHRRRDDGLARRHVFERLGRADELGRLVDCERHQADIPAGDELRQQRVRLLAEPVQVGPPRQCLGLDLGDRADHDDLPRGVGVGEGRDQLEVEPLVDDAEEAEPRPRDPALQRVGALHRGGVGRRAPERIVLGVDRARHAQHVRIRVALGLVQAWAAGDDEVGALQQRGLALAHLARRALECRELVHAVVDDRARRELAEHRQRHRRVEPDEIVVDQVVGEVAGDHRLERRELVVVEAPVLDRRVRAQHLDSLARRRALEIGGAARVHRLLDEDDVVVARQPRQQVLRPLEDELPTQVREDDEVVHGTFRDL